MTKALLLVDLSNDFIRMNGALNCGPAGVAIVPYCLALVSAFIANGDVVFDARDDHDLEDFEIRSGLFSPHNLRGTEGQKLISELADLLKEQPAQWVYLPKKNYNAGYQTRLFPELMERNITELHVIGVCTDICVRYTLNGLYEFKTTVYPQLELYVHEKGVASFNERGHEDSIGHFSTALGCRVISH